MIETLDKSIDKEREEYFIQLAEMTNRICNYVTRNSKELRKGIGDIMVVSLKLVQI